MLFVYAFVSKSLWYKNTSATDHNFQLLIINKYIAVLYYEVVLSDFRPNGIKTMGDVVYVEMTTHLTELMNQEQITDMLQELL